MQIGKTRFLPGVDWGKLGILLKLGLTFVFSNFQKLSSIRLPTRQFQKFVEYTAPNEADVCSLAFISRSKMVATGTD